MNREFTILHLFSGIGGAALGFQQAVGEYRGVVGRFRTLAGIDCDPEACQDFEMLTGAPAVQLDLFSHADYEAFHGHQPPPDWKEVEPSDLLAATGGEYPDVIFLSPPCKGFSSLLPAAKAASQKYQALNRLVTRGLELVMAAFADDLPGIILLENVPRITSRGKLLLAQVRALLGYHGYVFHEGSHDCGELGGLGQHRDRYLLIARLPSKVPSFVYRPPKRRVKAIGEVLSLLPLPGDPKAGRMHRVPRLAWLTSLRLALIRAGGDHRDLASINPEEYRTQYVPRGGGPFGVQAWEEAAATVTGHASPRGSNAASVADPRLGHDPREGAGRVLDWHKPSPTVTGASRVFTSNGPACVADPRTEKLDSRHPAVYQVVRYDRPAPCITGTRFGSGAPGISDPRMDLSENAHYNLLRVTPMDQTAGTVTGATRLGAGGLPVADPQYSNAPGEKFQGSPGLLGVLNWHDPAHAITGSASASSSNCPAAVADPRLGCTPRTGSYGVHVWDEPGKTVIGAGDVHATTAAVTDPRVTGGYSNKYQVLNFGNPATTVTGTPDVQSGAQSVADPRIPANQEKGVWIIISLDGTWHRPLTTLECAALQDFPVVLSDGRPLILAGKSDARHRERIGNAVPRSAAKAMGEETLLALLNERGDFHLSNEGIWVAPNVTHIPVWAVEGTDVER